ncbi:MAG: RES family NAD+ phosphorylase [Bdellovibrionota bacterium]
MEQSIASFEFRPFYNVGSQILWRSIPTCFPTKGLFYPESLDEEEQQFASVLADATAQIDPVEEKKNRWSQYGDNETLEFCFKDIDIPISRFTSGDFPVWYGSNDQECSKAEVTYHRIRQANHELQYAKKENYISFEFAFCKAEIKSDKCIDIRHLTQSTMTNLLEDGPPYPFCNEFGSAAKSKEVQVLRSKSRRWQDGELWAVFAKDVILSSIVKAYWHVVIFKNGQVTICNNPVQFSNGWMSYV